MSTALASEPLLTAEEFAARPDPGYPEELIRGRVVCTPPPKRRHGQICAKVVRMVGNFVAERDLGHVLSNDAGVITERGPDSVRGPDVAFYSYDRLPKGPAPHDYAQQPPELVIEVLSEFERWPSVLAKVAEYLGAGITLVLLLEDREQSAHVYRADAPTRILRSSEVLELPDILADFRARITDFFE